MRMADQRIQRKLAAIFVADIVGYSRAVEADETGMLARVKALRAEFLHPTVARFGGRIVKTTGDGTLIEFSSVVDAVQNAVEVQREMARRNATAPNGERIELRIGINLGDIVVEDGDIHGDGVNVATRLEQIAPPGGICVSASVREQVGNRLGVRFEDTGEQRVKNITRPIRTYRVAQEPDPVAAAAHDASTAPEKPSIAALPFVNMSGDPEQEYFADGITEDITAALSRFHWFFVIDRNSSFTYKGKIVDVKQVGRELGVHYVLEGSVRRDGNRVRITVQLIEANAGRHVWAERYDRDLKDIFAVQDEIAETIVGAVAPEFVSAEARRAERKRPEDLDAWDHAMRGNWHLWRIDKASFAAARQHFERALARDPQCVAALGGLALACSWQVVWGWAADPAENRYIAREMARRAVAADPKDAWAHAVHGLVAQHRRDSHENIRSCRRALDLNPNLAMAEGSLALAYAWLGEAEEAIQHADRAQRLSPRDPSLSWWLMARITAAFVNERYDELIEWARKMTEIAPDHPVGWRFLAGGLAHIGRIEEAHAALEVFLRLVPHYTVRVARTSHPAARDDLLDRLIDDLRKAGVPE
jgi:TolB-like protein